MRLEPLLDELEGIISGDPEFIRMMTLEEIENRTYAIISSIFHTIGYEEITKELKKKRFVFDMALKGDFGKIGIELKFGKISENDINRYSIMTEASSKIISKLIIFCSDLPRDIETHTNNIIKNIPMQIMTFNQLIHLLRRPRGEGITIIQDLIKSSPTKLSELGEEENWEDYIKDYIISTFGEDVFNTISKDYMSLSIFSQNRDFLGNRPVKIILTGTTHTGKSTIANRLFGEAITDTAEHTDCTGEITKIVLQNQVEVYDTPGVGGINDEFENVTRAFLGINQSDDLKTVDKIPFIDLSDPNNPKNYTLSNPIKYEKDSIIIFVFDLFGGLKRADYNFYKLLKKKIPEVIIVGNKMDVLDSENEIEKIRIDISKRVGLDFISIAADPNEGEPIGMDRLVQRICYVLSDNTLLSFNERLVSSYKRKQDFLIKQTIERFSSKAAIIKPFETIPGRPLPVLQSLMIGLLMRLGIDYKVGGQTTKDDIIDTTKNLFLHVTSKKTERTFSVKKEKKKEERWIDQSSQGGVIGASSLALTGGIIAGPFGAFIGAIIGGIVGVGVGSRKKIKHFITKLWKVPIASVEELPGGTEASLTIITFGFSLWKILKKIKEDEIQDFDPELFKESINKTYDNLNKAITQQERAILDSTANEKEARQIIHNILERMSV